MHAPIHVSDAGVALIAAAEGFSATLYNCAAGHCTIGYGHLVHRGRTGADAEAEGDFRGGVSEERARALLRVDIAEAERTIARYITVPLSQPQIDALASFIFNIGEPAFVASTMLKLINEGLFRLAAAQFDRWVMAGERKLEGLVVRRTKERALFERGRL